jgi:hypothetical protein
MPRGQAHRACDPGDACTSTAAGYRVNLKIITGGQTGVDRGALIAALDNGWNVGGYMPLDGRDELGAIPLIFAAHLTKCDRPGFAARTEANVAIAHALLIIVPDAEDPKSTPGTKKTLELAAARRLPRMVVAPTTEAVDITRWIRTLSRGGLQLTFDRRSGFDAKPLPEIDGDELRLMVAGPRESKWPVGRIETAGLLRRVKIELAKPPDVSRMGRAAQ